MFNKKKRADSPEPEQIQQPEAVENSPELEPEAVETPSAVAVPLLAVDRFRAVIVEQKKGLDGPQFEQFVAAVKAERKAVR